MAIFTATDSNYEELTTKGTVLIEFWAPWCAPCRMLAPVLDELQSELGGRLTMARCNVDEYGQLAVGLHVMSIPTMILFKDGIAKEKIVGYQSLKALQSLIKPHL